MGLRIPVGVKIDTKAYTVPNICNNMLSLDNVIKSCGPILFTQSGKFLLPAQFAAIIKPKTKLASNMNGKSLSQGRSSTEAAKM